MIDLGIVTKTYNFQVFLFELKTKIPILTGSFYKKIMEYFHKKYGLSLPHSEVQEFAQKHEDELSSLPNILDLGCGRGRNSLYLSQYGGNISSYDKSVESLSFLKKIATREGIQRIATKEYDINTCSLPRSTFDIIMSTVVLMFVDPENIPSIIANMKEATRPGGYHIIVVAMDTKAYPCMMPFTSPFKEGELKGYYADDWTVLKYNENVGHLHKKDEEGNPIALQFATLVAQKRSTNEE